MSRMNKRMAIEIAMISLYLIVSFTVSGAIRMVTEEVSEPTYVEATPIIAEVYTTSAPKGEPKVLEEIPEEVPVESVEDLEAELWCDSLEYLAMCVEAEAGNQSELGKRLVCDTVLNRFDSGKYETLYDVINEENQYSVVSDGRIFEVIPAESTYRVVAEELENRTNTEVLYFRTKHYHEFGTPLFVEGAHYFSK